MRSKDGYEIGNIISFLNVHRCFNCSKRYKTLNSLRRHRRVECGKTKDVICAICNHSFYYKQDLQKHIHKKH
ncbi:unnamed protein product [Phaedon cochleariae]|uniref:C2H2-type domain-containing protein n=1 Tax=Phaedon cochleariae TaxID=80249 RepID=A0A9P0DI44_PHACE|nr:unnamed protein product [Phaedon cochleariae]